MSKLDRRSVIVSGSALLPTGVFASVGAGSTEDDGNESDADVDDETETDAHTGQAFDAEPTDSSLPLKRGHDRSPSDKRRRCWPVTSNGASLAGY